MLDIQQRGVPNTGWTRLADALQTFGVAAIELNDSELGSGAQACRVAMAQGEKDRDAQASPTVRANFDATAKRYAALAAKLVQARRLGECTR